MTTYNQTVGGCSVSFIAPSLILIDASSNADYFFRAHAIVTITALEVKYEFEIPSGVLHLLMNGGKIVLRY